ncbi:two pore domain potassium channel family protein [Mesorhizobium sp. CGMCC 1.15528]|uniref:Two pore domain potassium channel family protein n=1 Tax=Mesorhizobium zhangyense TaxID=1776730 RepID=A0A7C9R4W9_9HYPH|nr:potassium channel family protein [Mesorhizobium zhangyense]NGN40075.1 two pore domain potassium channel family protein [Mesorhizobium zhangyense]
MIENLLLATVFDVLTFLVHAAGLIALTHVVSFLLSHPLIYGKQGEKALAMGALALGLYVLVCVELAIWAVGMLAVGALPDFETAFYFSASTFATIGFNDVTPLKEWRLLSAMEGITGLLIMGWTAAYLVTSGVRFGPFERDKHF